MNTEMFQKAVAAVQKVLPQINAQDGSGPKDLVRKFEVPDGPFTVRVCHPLSWEVYNLTFDRDEGAQFDKQAAAPVVKKVVDAFLSAVPREQAQIWVGFTYQVWDLENAVEGVLHGLAHYPEHVL